MRLALFSAAYYGVARLGLSIAVVSGTVTSFWPATGIALAVLLLWGLDLWPGVLLGAFLANLSTGIPLNAVCVIATGNTLQAVCAYTLLRRGARICVSLGRLRDVLALAVLGAGLSAVVGSTVGTAALCQLAALPWRQFGRTWFIWWQGDAIGVVLFAPLLLAWATSRPYIARRRIPEALLLLTSLGVTLYVIFADLLVPGPMASPATFVLFPFIIWAALRFGQRGATTATVLVGCFATWWTVRIPPLSLHSPGDPSVAVSITVQLFIGMLSITGMVLAAVMLERDRAEQALRGSEERYRFMADAMPQIVFRSHPDGRLDYYNQRWREYMGSTGNAKGDDRTEASAGGFEWLAFVHPEDRDRTAALWGRAVDAGEAVELQHRLYRATDGVYRWHLVRSAPQRDAKGNILGWVGTATDIHDLKEAREELFRREQEFKALVEHAPDIIARFDTEGRYLYVNPAITAVTGLLPGACLGRTNRDLGMPEGLCAAWDEAVRQTLATGREQQVEFTCPPAPSEASNPGTPATPSRPPDDGTRWFQSRSVPEFGHDGRVASVLLVAHDITERKRIEAEQHTFVALIQNSCDFIGMTTLDGRPTFLNDAGCKLLGIDHLDARKHRTLYDVHAPDHAAFFYEVVLPQVLATGQWEGEVQLRSRATGKAIHVAKNTFLVRDPHTGEPLCTATVTRDITEQKRGEAEREHLLEVVWAERNRLETVLQQMPAGVLLADAITGALVSNDYAEQWLHQPALELFGLEPNERWRLLRSDGTPCPPDDIPLRRAIRAGEVITGEELDIASADGSRRTIRANAAPIRDRSRQIIAGVMTFYDVTGEKQAEEALRHAKEMAEEANSTRGRFLANMSHELRTPLNSIIGFSEMLVDQLAGPLNEKQARYLSHIHASGSHLLDLINDILDLAKIDAGKVALEFSEFDALKVVQTIKDVVSPLATGKNIQVLATGPGDLPLLIADEAKFKQIVYNLLSNAVKFTPEGGCVHIGVDCDGGTDADHAPGLEAADQPRRKVVRVSVTDNGIGIKPADQQRIFEQFEQVDSSYARTQQGTGLGLALTRRLVELHGGRIWLESEGVEGRGSVFTFTIPLTPELSCADSPAPEEQDRQAVPAARRPAGRLASR